MHDDLTRLGLIDEDAIVLDEAALDLAMLDHPNADPAPYVAVLEGIAECLAAYGEVAIDADDRAEALARVLNEDFGFVGDAETYDDPANADLIRVIDRRRGLPVSLSILYVAAARRVGWTANILDIPGHVLVLVGDEADPVIIDPFRGGSQVTGENVARLLDTADAEAAPAVRHVAAMSNRAILIRLLLNQAMRAEQSGKGKRALELYHRMTEMAPGHAPAWWEAARLYLTDGDVPAARRSLTALLEVTRDPAARQRVTETLASLAVS